MCCFAWYLFLLLLDLCWTVLLAGLFLCGWIPCCSLCWLLDLYKGTFLSLHSDVPVPGTPPESGDWSSHSLAGHWSV